MIGGFIIGPSQTSNLPVIIRALGPSLESKGIQDPLKDPTLRLYDGNGTSMATNDNWQSDQKAAILATGIQPPKPAEAAIVTQLAPGAYTAIVRGKAGAQGVALVEVYALP